MRTRISYLALLLPALILSSGGSVAAQTAAPIPSPAQLLEITTLYGKAEQVVTQEYDKVLKEAQAKLAAPSGGAATTPAALAALMSEVWKLRAEKKLAIDELRKHKQKVLSQPVSVATKPVQLAPVCGTPTSSQGMVILVPGTDAGKLWHKTLEDKLGAFKAVQSSSLQGGATAGERFARVTAINAETLVEDGGLLAPGGDYSARAKQAILARSLLLTKRIIVVRAPGALSASEKASAKAWGWRSLGDKDTVKSVLCPAPVSSTAPALPLPKP